jgi:hypothetical protein
MMVDQQLVHWWVLSLEMIPRLARCMYYHKKGHTMDEYPFIQAVPLLNSIVVVMVCRHVTIDVDGYCMVITCSLNTNIITSCINVLRTKIPTLSTYVKLTCWLSITSSCTNVSRIVVAIFLHIGEYWIWYNDYILFMYQCTKNCNNYLLSICWPWVQQWCCSKQCSSMHNNWMEQIHGSLNCF